MGKYNKADDSAAKLIKAGKSINKDILAVENLDGIRCYYRGICVALFSDAKKRPFNMCYNKVNSDILEKIKNDKQVEYIFIKDNNYANLDSLLTSTEDYFTDQHERRQQQDMTLNNISYEREKFSVCGFETKLETGGEIDMVIFCPEKNKMLLVEYKCKTGSLGGTNGIIKHGNDYSQVLDSPRCYDFAKRMLNSYNTMGELYAKAYERDFEPIDITENMVSSVAEKMEIWFLFTPAIGAKSTIKKTTRYGKYFSELTHNVDKIYSIWADDHKKVIFDDVEPEPVKKK